MRFDPSSSFRHKSFSGSLSTLAEHELLVVVAVMDADPHPLAGRPALSLELDLDVIACLILFSAAHLVTSAPLWVRLL